MRIAVALGFLLLAGSAAGESDVSRYQAERGSELEKITRLRSFGARQARRMAIGQQRWDRDRRHRSRICRKISRYGRGKSQGIVRVRPRSDRCRRVTVACPV